MQKGIFILVFLLASIPAFSQRLTKPFFQKVDSLFSDFNQQTPGCAIAIVSKDSILFSRTYGMANLEYGIPITSETVFNLASLSKQFTGMGIALLARQGKVNLDENIRNYLEWVPDFKTTITVRHLLHHTSGLRDHLIMSLLGGLPGNGLLTQDVAIKYIKGYSALNFPPGENHSYSNSNYVLLAEIIKKASGQSFHQFMDSAFFRPLGMMNSGFYGQNTVFKNAASSYVKAGNTFQPIMMNVFTQGDGGLTSTMADMSRWIMNFLNPKVGDKALVQEMVDPFYLANGKKTIYGMGLGAINFGGYTQYSHGGSIAGFRSSISIYPDLSFGTIVLSNHANGLASVKAGQVVEQYLKEIKAFKENTSGPVLSNTDFGDSMLAKRMAGNYLAQNGGRFAFTYRNGKLLFQNKEPIIAQSPTEWSLATDSSVTFSARFAANDTLIHHFAYGVNHLLAKYKMDSTMTSQMLRNYVGSYHSKELDLTLNVVMKNEQLYLNGFLLGEVGLQPLTRDNLFFRNGVTHLKMLRDVKEKIFGFDYSNGTLTKVRFVKTAQSSN